MTRRILAILLAAGPGLLFGQLESNTLTISASRVLNIQPDQALFNVTIVSTPTQGLDDVLAALQATGITAANFSSLNSLPDGTLQWLFNLPIALTKVQTTAASLVSLQQTIAKSNNGLTLSFYIGSLQVSSALAQSQSCPVADLVSDAQAHAQKLADAAGLTVGSILTINGSSANVSPPPMFYSNLIFGELLTGVVYPAPEPPPCAITLKFRLLRYQ